MDNFIVSARKYRPASFETVVGQKALTSTLKNSIKNGQLAHAYLFCGPRGVGKTTCARIFAKTINCSSLTDDYDACEQCDSCKSFNDSRSFNIRELDAASNNSVDDIRNLIDQVRIPPQMGKYSVYIIDEVHMLSAAAFNAFLKTLEEPPAHAIFILATTEKHKIIPTILSRCQIYDFSRIRIEDIVNHLEYVAKKEGVKTESEALGLIAQKADGAMRDALSIFDQLVSFSGGNITYLSTLENLNVLDYDYYINLTECFLNSNIKQTFLIFDEILQKGFDGQYFISGLSSHFRDLLVCKDASSLHLLEVGASIKEKYKQQSNLCEIVFLYEAMKIANDCDLNYKTSQNKRFHIELTLLRLSYIMEEKKKSENKKLENPPPIEKPETSEKITVPEKKSEPKVKQAVVENPIISEVAADIDSGEKKPPESVASTISINQLIKENSSDNGKSRDKELGSETKKQNPFTQENLDLALKNFASKLESSKPRLYNTLLACAPILLENHEVKISFINDLQQSLFNEVKSEFLEFLREQLNNDLICLITELEIKSEENLLVNRLYSDDDKFKFLCEKNPNLSNLKDLFKLDFYS